MVRILIALVYPLLMLARFTNIVTGRDSLRRRRPSAGSLWIPREETPTAVDYFSQESPVEHKGPGMLATAVLNWMARFFAPPRDQPRDKVSAGPDREQGIPDEMYTLW